VTPEPIDLLKERALVNMARAMSRRAHREPGVAIARRHLTMATAARWRARVSIDDALEYAVERNWLTPDGSKFRAGESIPVTPNITKGSVMNTYQQLYRLFNADDELLYIGVSMSALKRIGEHRADKDWWQEVAKITIETHQMHRSTIEELERYAIQTEQPKYNKRHAATEQSAPSKKSSSSRKHKSRFMSVGDVIAAGMRGVPDCPIGMIAADSISDPRLAYGDIVLELFNFGTGYFDAGYRVIRMLDVEQIKVANLIEDEWSPKRELIYDTARLGAFQTEWKRRHSDESAA